MTKAERSRKWRQMHPDKVKADNAARRKRVDRWSLNKFKMRWLSVRSRCTHEGNDAFKNYGARGIECRITWLEIAKLWFRDQAWMMKSPQLDRLDSAGHYEYSNCRFIEQVDNLNKMFLEKACKEPKGGYAI